jgi:hypothetical protein
MNRVKRIYIVAGIVAVLLIVLFWHNDFPRAVAPLDETLQNITLSGTYVCLPFIDTKTPPTEECVFGLKTDEGEYYMVNFGQSASAKEQFDRRHHITAQGFVVIKEASSSLSDQLVS